MSVIEDPGSNSEPVGPDRASDDLEHWLSDLRTEVSAAPHEWINKDSVDGQPTEPAPLTHAERVAEASKPAGGGRHRAAD